MKAERKILSSKKSKELEPTESKMVAVPAWAPQPNPLTPAEIRKIVIDQIG
ncbi:hypothetical protein [Microvirga makkahensis]|uniref:Uncharacterized protein n=1 Tax=Microvirga makkahensis TaxID=1128670 RepID=A0A7X3MPA0_9HYPH|nr:hypothetical protein [Microvirga makkahensis]MXQ10510.1 hypothetical protein [Microvirga makkahensis]